MNRPEREPAPSESSRPHFPAMLSAAGWALRTTWTTNPRLAAGFLVFTTLRSLAPGGIALVARGLINSAIHEVKAGGRDLMPLLPWLAAGLLLGLVEALMPLAGRFCRQRLTDDLNVRIIPDVLRHAAELDIAAFEDPEQREIIDRAQHGAAQTVSRFITDLEAAVAGVLQTVLLAAILTHLEPLVSLVVGLLGLPYLFTQWRRRAEEHAQDSARNAKRRWGRYFTSALMGQASVAEIRLLGIGPFFADQARLLMTRARDEDRRTLRGTFLRGSAFALLATVGLWAVFARVAMRVVQGSLTIGDVAVFAAASPRLRAALDRAIVALSDAMEQALSIEQLRAFFRLRPRVRSGSGVVPSPERGELEIEDVWFTYPGATTPVLSGISLTLRRGEIVGLVGPNGAGKTTLVKLIARLYDPDRGRIVLDGTNLRDWPLVDLHRRIALVSQDALRFEATAANNVAYGDWPRAASDRRRIREAMAAAGGEEMIHALPDGYDTMLGRMFGQHDLSGGQWQKIALARAFVRDSPILVLDEPTTHLDAAAVHELQRHLGDLGRGRTTLLISHRLETLRLADRILLMERGRITDTVTHAELVARAGHRAEVFPAGPPLAVFDGSTTLGDGS